MPEIQFEIKGWPAVALIVALVLGAVLYLTVIPGRLRGGERDAIIDALRADVRRDLAESAEALTKAPDNQVLRERVLALSRESSKKIAIVSATVRPRGLSLAKRARLEYTVTGEAGNVDRHVGYFRVFQWDEGRTAYSYRVTEISKERYESWW